MHEFRLNQPRIILLLFFIGFLAYSNAIFHPFVHDDVVFIEQNPRIAHLDLKEIFLYSPLQSTLMNVYYRPFLELIYRLQYKIFHFNPHGYHLFNVLLHIANSILIFLIIHFIRRGKKEIALGAALLFLLHPVQTESVACISGISNLMFTTLCLLSFLIYVKVSPIELQELDRERGARLGNEFSLYLISLGLFFIALLAKEQAFILPLIIILYEWSLNRESILPARTRVVRVAGYFVVLLSYLSFRKLMVGGTLAPGIALNSELALRLLAIPQTVLMYLKIIFWPAGLHYYRNTDILMPFVAPMFILTGVIVLGFVLVRLISPSSRRWISFGLGWFFISLLPTLNIIPLINEYSFILSAEHFLYFPLIGLSLAAGESLALLEKRFVLVLIAIAGIFLVLTVRQNTVWRGEIPLFERTLQFEPGLGRVHGLLAKAYYFQGRFQEANQEFERALNIMQGYADKVRAPEVKRFYLGFIKGIHFEWAYSYQAMGDFPRAIKHYQEAVKLDPRDAVVYNNLGLVYLQSKNFEKAREGFLKAIEFNPNDLMAMNNLAICYIEEGKLEEAEKILNEIVKKNSQFIPAQDNLKRLLSEKKSH